MSTAQDKASSFLDDLQAVSSQGTTRWSSSWITEAEHSPKATE